MLPTLEGSKRNEVGVKRSQEIVTELEKMEKVDYAAMDAAAKRSLSSKKEELRGELFQITKGVRYALLDETLNDLKHVNQFLEEPEVIKEEIEFYDHTTRIQPQIPPPKKVTVGGKELTVDPSLDERWQKENPVREVVEERSRRVLTVKTNRAQIAKLKNLLAGFRQTILHDSSLWSLSTFDEEKKKVEVEIAVLDLSEMSEEKLTKDQWESLQYALHTKDKEL